MHVLKYDPPYVFGLLFLEEATATEKLGPCYQPINRTGFPPVVVNSAPCKLSLYAITKYRIVLTNKK